METIYVYKGHNNRFSIELEAHTVSGDLIADAPLTAATRVTLTTDNGLAFDSSDSDGVITIDDGRSLTFHLGPSFVEKTEGDPVSGFLSIFYADRPDGIAWPASEDSQHRPTFRFLPVGWEKMP